MKVINETLEMVPVGSLTPHPRNPRQGDVGAIRQSIDANGFYGALVVQKSSGYVLAGNHRLLAARETGAKHLPVMYVDVEDDVALRILLADNRTNDLASYDDHALADLLEGIVEDVGTLEGTGYDMAALEDLLADLGHGSEDNAIPVPPEEDAPTVVREGETWIMGPHRLLCGDSTNAEVVVTITEGTKPSVMIFDPPFDLAYDAWQVPDQIRLLMVWARGHQGLRWVGERVGDPPLWGVSTLAFSGQARGWAMPEWPSLIHEVVYVMRRGKGRGKRCRSGPAKAYGLRVTVDDRPFSFYDGLASRRNDMSWAKNPACFAVFLCMALDGEVVYDPCAGSGASLLACQASGNVWRGVENQPKWADMCIRRWQEQTSLSATLGEAGTTFAQAEASRT